MGCSDGEGGRALALRGATGRPVPLGESVAGRLCPGPITGRSPTDFCRVLPDPAVGTPLTLGTMAVPLGLASAPSLTVHGAFDTEDCTTELRGVKNVFSCGV